MYHVPVVSSAFARRNLYQALQKTAATASHHKYDSHHSKRDKKKQKKKKKRHHKNGGGPSINPGAFLQCFRRKAPWFVAGRQHDAHELLRTLISIIDDETEKERKILVRKMHRSSTSSVDGAAAEAGKEPVPTAEVESSGPGREVAEILETPEIDSKVSSVEVDCPHPPPPILKQLSYHFGSGATARLEGLIERVEWDDDDDDIDRTTPSAVKHFGQRLSCGTHHGNVFSAVI